MMLREWMKFPLALFFLLLASPAFAGPSPGKYELYNGAGQKTGRIETSVIVSTETGNPVYKVQSKTEMTLSNFFSKYSFTEIDSAEIGTEGLRRFRRDTNDNGKKSFVEGDRQDKNLFIRVNREGKKFVTAIPCSSFNMSEYETELASSPFYGMKTGEQKTVRVFFVEELDVFPVTRKVTDQRTMPFDGQDMPVLVVSTVIKGKATTSWFHVLTHALLQEEGKDYFLTRVGE
jgi:hypothetical protein